MKLVCHGVLQNDPDSQRYEASSVDFWKASQEVCQSVGGAKFQDGAVPKGIDRVKKGAHNMPGARCPNDCRRVSILQRYRTGQAVCLEPNPMIP
jgi:hypothetical protein